MTGVRRTVSASLTLIGACFVALGLVVFVIYPAWLRHRDDPTYAATYFAPIAPDAVPLASRRWHAWRAEPWDCSYAIVRLALDAPAAPPVPAREREGWWLRWPEDWSPTPAPALGDTTRDALGYCARYWPEEISRELDGAMSAPGSFYARDAVGETLHIWSAPMRIAARVRYGD